MTILENQTNGVMGNDVLIIGGGFAGCYALYKFRQLGLRVKLLEAGSDFGGVWNWNQYPGARVDSEMPCYQFSIPEVWETFNFSQRFPDHYEIRSYFAHVDKVLQLRKDAYFSTTAYGISYANKLWTTKTTDGRIFKSKFLILATGSTHKAYHPKFEGLENYQGNLIHSSAYPNDGIDVEGKRVGVIGNGATALQIIQELSKKNCNMTVFIRTPVVALPMCQRDISTEESEALKIYYDTLFTGAKVSQTGFPYNIATESILNKSKEEQDAILEYLWKNPGFYAFARYSSDSLKNPEINDLFYQFWVKKTGARISDPEKRKIAVPLKQTNYLGTKRLSLEQDYYESIDRPNVELVDLKKTPIQKFTEKGILTDREHKLDIVINATGFDNLTGSLMDLKIQDKYGVELKEKWKQGTATYLGMMIAGMPNMFMVYGPQAPTSLANGPPFIENQVDWMVTAIQKMMDEGHEVIEAQDEAVDTWKKKVHDVANETHFRYANSWYMGANIPGKIREPLLYLGGMVGYMDEITKALDGWKGFYVSK